VGSTPPGYVDHVSLCIHGAPWWGTLGSNRKWAHLNYAAYGMAVWYRHNVPQGMSNLHPLGVFNASNGATMPATTTAIDIVTGTNAERPT